MLTKDKPVQGYVIYAEFCHGENTRQIFFTPDGFTSEGRFVPMTAFYRTVSKDNPRKQWKTTTCHSRDVREALAADEAGNAPALDMFTSEWAQDRLGVISGYMRQLVAHGWTMTGAPLVVEASKQDMADVSAYKTPTKIIYRINQSRNAAGFPADLF